MKCLGYRIKFWKTELNFLTTYLVYWIKILKIPKNQTITMMRGYRIWTPCLQLPPTQPTDVATSLCSAYFYVYLRTIEGMGTDPTKQKNWKKCPHTDSPATDPMPAWDQITDLSHTNKANHKQKMNNILGVHTAA